MRTNVFTKDRRMSGEEKVLYSIDRSVFIVSIQLTYVRLVSSLYNRPPTTVNCFSLDAVVVRSGRFLHLSALVFPVHGGGGGAQFSGRSSHRCPPCYCLDA